MTDEKLKVLIEFLWDNGCNALTAAELLRKQGVTVEQFKRVWREVLCLFGH